MNKRYFFFDLDGPILDVSEKYYQVYKSILEKSGFSVISKSDYWRLKQSKTPEKEILALTGAEGIIDAYRSKRKKLIETDDFLKFDRVQEKALEVLGLFSERFETVLVTLRSNPTQLHKQLANFGLTQFFRKVLSADGDREQKWMIKVELVCKEFGKIEGKNFFIGDTETDINAGKELGCSTIGVVNGIRSESIMLELKPTWIINTVGDLLNIKIE